MARQPGGAAEQGQTYPQIVLLPGDGKGIEIPAALREGQRQGIKHYFIEDESADPVGQIPRSLCYLEALAW